MRGLMGGATRRRQRLSERHPALYPLAVWVNRARRRIDWLRSGTAWARERAAYDLAVRVRRHKSLLLRSLGESEMYLQHNKVTNLAIAAARVDEMQGGGGRRCEASATTTTPQIAARASRNRANVG